jgi:hypothetical protein
MKRLRNSLTFANVIAVIALFVALGGGAYAATRLPASSVGTKQLKKEAVTPGKLSATAKAAITGATGAKGATGPQGDSGPAGQVGPQGPTGPAGSAATSGPVPIDASAPESPLATTDSMLSLDGRTSWTAPDEPAGLLLAQLRLKLATKTEAQGEDCTGTVHIFDNGKAVAELNVGVPAPGFGFGKPTTLTEYQATTDPIGIGLLDRSETQAITAEYVGINTIDCATGSEFEGLRITVQPQG